MRRYFGCERKPGGGGGSEHVFDHHISLVEAPLSCLAPSCPLFLQPRSTSSASGQLQLQSCVVPLGDAAVLNVAHAREDRTRERGAAKELWPSRLLIYPLFSCNRSTSSVLVGYSCTCRSCTVDAASPMWCMHVCLFTIAAGVAQGRGTAKQSIKQSIKQSTRRAEPPETRVVLAPRPRCAVVLDRHVQKSAGRAQQVLTLS